MVILELILTAKGVTAVCDKCAIQSAVINSLINIWLIMSQHVSPRDSLHVKQNNFLRKDMI